MKFLAFLSLAAAALAAGIPSCALNCIVNAVEKQCGSANFKCGCDNFDALESAAMPCVLSACEGADVTGMLGFCVSDLY